MNARDYKISMEWSIIAPGLAMSAAVDTSSSQQQQQQVQQYKQVFMLAS